EWMRADAAVRTLSSALLDLPPCSAADTLRRIRLSARVRYLTDGAVTDGVDPDEMAEEDVREVATAALRALKQAAVPAPAPEWEAAKAAYITARADADMANARAQAALAQLEESHPVPDILCLSDGRRYFLESHIERDVREPFRGNRRLSLDEAAEKLAALRQFTPLYEAESERLGVERLEGEYAAALSRQGQLANALINTPAPTAEAVLEKLQVMTYEFHGVETADDVSELLTGDDPDAWVIARVMQDLMRLTGSASPLADAQPFDADAYIAAFESNPAHRMTAFGPTYLELQGDIEPTGLAEWSALKDWQKRAVRDQAKRRDRAAAAETQQRGAGPTIASPKLEGD
ncbi:MAG: hypothetical protein WAZ50_02785, partial [Minisyncoccia bacterium]